MKGKMKGKFESEDKTVNMTFRIKKETLEKIRHYADTKDSTINSVINQFLAQVLDWDILAAKAGWVPIPKNALINILDEVDENNISKLAEKNGKTIPNDFLLAMKGRLDIRDLLEINKNRAYAAGFGFSEILEDDHLRVIIQHDMGIKWSNYFMKFYDEGFKSLGCNAEFEITDNTLVYKINKKYYNKK